MKTASVIPALFALILIKPLSAQEPQLNSVLPLGGTTGTSFEIEIHGRNLEGAQTVWFDCNELRASIHRIETGDDGKGGEESRKQLPPAGTKKVSEQRLIARIEVAASAKVGTHVLRLVTPRGVSGPLAFQVNEEPAVTEIPTAHATAAEAQPLRFPVVVSGRIGELGELDYYAIDVSKGQELQFEVITGSGLFPASPGQFRVPQLFLYEPSGSWFDPRRIARVECEDESIFFTFPRQTYSSHYLPRLSRRFDKPGKFLLEVSGFQGDGGPAHTYQLRVVLVDKSSTPFSKDWTPRVLAHSSGSDWLNRDLARRLEPDRLTKLQSRTLRVGAKDHKAGGQATASANTKGRLDAAANDGKQVSKVDPLSSEAPLNSVRESEPNDSSEQALSIKIPALIEGNIGSPRDRDYFKFEVKQGDALVFEIETPQRSFPYFSPRLSVADAAGQEILSNIYRVVAGDGDDWIKTVEPKTIYTFERDGEFYLQVRDLTSRRGAPDMAYRILVRRQVPHLGRVAPETFAIHGGETEVDHINLAPGDTKTLTLVSDQEEGFSDEIALSLENLPPGIRVLPVATAAREMPSQAGQVYEARGSVHKERFRPERHLTTIMLIANPDAPATEMPQMISFRAQTALPGRLGPSIRVYEMPLMIVQPAGAQLSSSVQNK